ncbi:MAG: hypothetical protein ACKVPY_06740 [Paracoccaceae bacterium]
MRRPLPPALVALVAVLLPGVGQVLNRQPYRGIGFLFFMLLLGAVTLKTAAPEVSVVGKLSGGIFVWAMSVFDAYRSAKLRAALSGQPPKQG